MRPKNTFGYIATLAASVGLCTAIAVGPAGVAAADPADGPTDSSADATGSSDRGTATAGRANRAGREGAETGSQPAEAGAGLPDGPAPTRATTERRGARGAGPDPVDRDVQPAVDAGPAAAVTPAAVIQRRPGPATSTSLAPASPADPDLPRSDGPPTEAPPTEAPPTEAPPTEAPPTEAPPTDDPPAGPAPATATVQVSSAAATAPPATERPAPAAAAVMRAPAAGSVVTEPISAAGGGLPALQPVPWVVAAVARRQWAGAPAVTVAPPSATVSAAAILGNRPPVITSVTVGRGDPATGVVTAVVTATDPNRDRLTYTASGSTKGRASINSAGVLTYTPTPTARHAAAREQAAPQVLTDTIRVTVRDTRFARVSTTVTVPIVPRNSVPVAQTTVGLPDATNGVVTGRVSATDADRDPLTFTAVAATAKGSVQLSTSGNFTYTPTGAARHSAARLGASPAEKSDNFTVTVRDGYGAVVTVPVTVAIAPRNAAPVAGTTTVGTPVPATGAVAGTVRGTDSDGDSLTFSAPASTVRGNISINQSSGSFTYIPTTAARNAAAAPGATDADRRDSFTVTLADGFGGAAAVAVSVPISPATAPVNRPPTATVTVNPADPATGRVTGTINGRDADGDPLSYTAGAATPKGQVNVNASTGSFSYTPSTAARDAAAAPGATDADRQDGFTVTVADNRGGTVAVPVSVPVAPTPPTPPTPTNLAAFPGAEGFGAAATGGRGGSVVYVTNLNSSGPGSLQWAIDQPGAKYILFKVSGVINDQIHLTNGNVTIAGQTSPGGITIRGFVTDESPFQDQEVRPPGDFAENWILQHVRIRPGADGISDDGLRLRYTRNAIVDHVSIGNATDEAMEISYSNNITVQNTLLAETVGYHAEYGGILMNYSNPAHGFGLDNVSLHHNVFNRIWGRLPEGSRESLAAANSTMNLELSNNLYWDPRFFIALGQNTGVVTNAGGDPYPIYWKINAVNNFFRTGTAFPYGMFDDQILRNPTNQLYLSGNKMSLYPTRSDYELFYCCNDYASLSSGDVAGLVAAQRAQKRTTRHPFPAITYTPTDQLRSVLANTAGAWPRDPMDTRLMQSVAANTIATAPIDANPAGDALRPAYTGAAPTAPTDTDGDGMPDSWEVTKGLNPSVPNTNARTLSSLGYTDLEVYLHELSASRISPTVL